ncbi:unnamed protein product [Meloidogyne enterolobii]|uniref:Uncharacterized protein n=1 Tax=Meloidogyne enterolobii TaxID=390850 RepID=A0ACB0XZD7_MELEN
METQKTKKEALILGKPIKEWAFWIIVAFLASLTIKDIVNLVTEYCKHPKKSDMSVRFNETMKMPNITFCMSREQAWSHFKLNSTENKQLWDKTIATQLANMTKKEDFLSKQWDYRIVMETYNLISTLTSMERETTAHGTVASIEKYNTQTRLEEIRKLSKRRSLQRFQRTTYDEDEVISTQLKITWLSQVQLWYCSKTFKNRKLKNQTKKSSKRHKH